MAGFFKNTWNKFKKRIITITSITIGIIGLIIIGYQPDTGITYYANNNGDTIWCKDEGEFVSVGNRLNNGEDLFKVLCYYMREDDKSDIGFKRGMLITIVDPVDCSTAPSFQELKDFIVIEEKRSIADSLKMFLVSNQPDSIINKATYKCRLLQLDFEKENIIVPEKGKYKAAIDRRLK